MSDRLIRRAGEALFGPRWQSDMARELSVSDRTIRDWVSGASEPPRGVYVDLLRLVVERGADLDDIETTLRERGAS